MAVFVIGHRNTFMHGGKEARRGSTYIVKTVY
jgi:hypothetical protein